MTTDTPLLLALGLFAFYSALGDILKATTRPTLRQAGTVFKLAAPLSAGYVAVQAGRGGGLFSFSFYSWNTIKSVAPYMALLLVVTHVLFMLDRRGLIKLDDAAGGAGEPPSAKPPPDAAAD